MFAGDSQMLRNKRHFIISLIAINVTVCPFAFIWKRVQARLHIHVQWYWWWKFLDIARLCWQVKFWTDFVFYSQLQLWLENPKQQLTFEVALPQIEAPYNSKFSPLVLKNFYCYDYFVFGNIWFWYFYCRFIIHWDMSSWICNQMPKQSIIEMFYIIF